MKKEIILLSLLLIVTTLSSQTQKTDLQRNRLNGKVKIMETKNKKWYFDHAGKLLDVKSRIIFLVPNHELEKDDLWISAGSKKGTIVQTKDGNPTEKHRFSNGKLTGILKKGYDAKGNLVSTSYFTPEGKTVKSYRYRNDKNGNVIQTLKYDSLYNLIEKTEWKFDAKGNQIREKSFDINGKQEREVICKYDKRGNLIEIKTFYDNKLSRVNRAKYPEIDQFGNWTQKIEETEQVSLQKGKMKFTDTDTIYRKFEYYD